MQARGNVHLRTLTSEMAMEKERDSQAEERSAEIDTLPTATPPGLWRLPIPLSRLP